MSATDAQIARLRRMTAEYDESTYTDADMASYIEQYPLPDSEGLTSDYTDWTATYDVNGAAAAIWDEKAASVAAYIDHNADGAMLNCSQQFTHAQRMAKHYRARMVPTRVKGYRYYDAEDESLYV